MEAACVILAYIPTVYKTTREGQFEALLDDIRIQLDVEFTDEEEHVTVTEKKCSARVEEVLVQLIPSMPSQIVNLLRERIQHRFNEKLCLAFTHYVGKVANIVKSLASIEDYTTRKGLPLSPCVIEHDRVATRLDSRGAKLSFKRAISREKRSAITNGVDEPEDLLSAHLNGDLPLRLNPHVHLQPNSAIFGHHRVIIPLNFKLDKKILPAFQFLHTSLYLSDRPP
ncbi:hypothetical protein COOONC_05017 [Cooperia oncophora]